MFNKWMYQNISLAKATELINSQIKITPLPDYATLTWNNQEEISLKINKTGKSEVKLSIKEHNNSVIIEEMKRDISFLHKPFIHIVENEITKIINNIGFKLT